MNSAFVRTLAALTSAALLTGCVSARYKSAPKTTPPAPRLELVATQPPVELRLDHLIVYHGPGSWKKDAWWDEYIVTIANHGETPVVVDAIVLADDQEMTVIPGEDPWALESLSRHRLKQYENTGRKVALGTGAVVVWVASPVVGLGAAFAGAGTAAAVSTTVFIGAPVLLIGSGIARQAARREILVEYNRRRLTLPLTLAPGQSRSGSFFLPITPGPRALYLRYTTGGNPGRLDLPLTGLADLHLATPAQASPAK